MYTGIKKHLFACYIILSILPVYAQYPENIQVVAITPFYADTYDDSIAAKYAYDAVARTFVQTKRFIILEPNESKKVQEEIERQKGKSHLKRPIIEDGASLGAEVLVIGIIKTAGIYRLGTHYSARVDYELKFVDVRTRQSIAAAYFTGDSDFPPNEKPQKHRRRKPYMPDSAVVLPGSDAVKNCIKPILIGAVESTTADLNVWVRATFNCNLSLLDTLKPGKKRHPAILIGGGRNMGITPGCKLRLVYVTEYYDQGRKLRDEEPIADLKIKQISEQTTRCKVVKIISKDRLTKGSRYDNMKIVFN